MSNKKIKEEILNQKDLVEINGTIWEYYGLNETRGIYIFRDCLGETTTLSSSSEVTKARAEYLKKQPMKIDSSKTKIIAHATCITWDLDEEDSVDLPKNVTYDFDRDMFDCKDSELEDEVLELVAEKLSDDYEYCHKVFNLTIEYK